MNKTCPGHKEYHTGCVACQHDCIEENEEFQVRIKQLEEAIWSTKCELMDMHLGEILDVPIDILQRALEDKGD